jgi:hypothetical protein
LYRGRHSPHVAFHCSLTYLHTDARAVPEGDSGASMASPQWGFYGLGSSLGSNEKVEMTLSTSRQVGRRPLGLICVFSPNSVQREASSGPLWVGLRTPVSWTPDFKSGGSSPRALWGSVEVGHVSCITPSSVARVSHSVSSLTGTSEWNSGPSFADVVGIALIWHSTTP